MIIHKYHNKAKFPVSSSFIDGKIPPGMVQMLVWVDPCQAKMIEEIADSSSLKSEHNTNIEYIPRSDNI